MDLVRLWIKQRKNVHIRFPQIIVMWTMPWKSRFSTNISLYLGNDIRCGHSYNGRRTGWNSYGNDPISNVLEWPQAEILMSRCSSTSNWLLDKLIDEITRQWYKIELYLQTDRRSYTTRLAVWLSGNALASINVFALRQTRLVLGWVTVCGRVNHFGM